MKDEKDANQEDKKLWFQFILMLISAIVGAMISIYITEIYGKDPSLLNKLDFLQVVNLILTAAGYILVLSVSLLILYYGAKLIVFLLKVIFGPLFYSIDHVIDKVFPQKNIEESLDKEEGFDITEHYKKYSERYNLVILLILLCAYFFKYSVYINSLSRALKLILLIFVVYSLLYNITLILLKWKRDPHK